MRAAATRDLLIYLHIPFCRSKCHFCDWVTEVPTSELLLRDSDQPRRRYIDALCKEIELRGPWLAGQGYRPRILYWGGGTASILTLTEIARLGAVLRSVFDLTDLVEATIECSPETLDPDKLAAFRELGFRRLSSGVQSFDDSRLRLLGRSHSAAEATRAIHMAAEAGFTDISIDLICGFPGQDAAETAESARHAKWLPLTHVALYPYRPTHGTVLRRQIARGNQGIDRDEQKRGYAAAAQVLVDAGLPEYAMSHFGSHVCHSDLAYFQLRMDWVGFGSGATSVLDGTYLAHRRGGLLAYNADPFWYDERYPVGGSAIAPRLLYQSLTTFEGVDRRWWQERTGRNLDEVLAEPGCHRLLDFFASAATLIHDEAGVRIARDEVVGAFIDLQYLTAPKQGRMTLSNTTAAVLG